MGMPSKTARDLARIMFEEVRDEQACLNILDRWKDVRGMPGNFRIVVEDIKPFVSKIAKKQDRDDSSTEVELQEAST